MIRQVVYVPLDNIESADERTKAIEAACNWDWLAEYRLVETSPYTNSTVLCVHTMTTSWA